LHLIKKKDQLMGPLALAMNEALDKVQICSTCGNADTSDPCTVCTDPSRDQSVIIVVEDVADLWALERAAAMNAGYHVLGGTLSPLDGVGPDDLSIGRLVDRVARGGVREILIAVNATVEGQTTAHYITEQLVRLRSQGHPAGPWRAGRRRARLSRRGHAGRSHSRPHRLLGECRMQSSSIPRPCRNRHRTMSRVEMATPGRSLVISGQIGVTPDGADALRLSGAGGTGLAQRARRARSRGMKISDITAIRVYDVAPGNVPPIARSGTGCFRATPRRRPM
jgi:hypothetical protein